MASFLSMFQAPPGLDYFLASVQPTGQFGSSQQLDPALQALVLHARMGDVPFGGLIAFLGTQGLVIRVYIKTSATSLLTITSYPCSSTDPPLPPSGVLTNPDLIVLAGSFALAAQVNMSTDQSVRDVLTAVGMAAVGFSRTARAPPATPAAQALPSTAVATVPGNSGSTITHPAVPGVVFNLPLPTHQRAAAKAADIAAVKCWAMLSANAIGGSLATLRDIDRDFLNKLLMNIPTDWRDIPWLLDSELFRACLSANFSLKPDEKDCFNILDILGEYGLTSRHNLQGLVNEFFDTFDVMFGTNEWFFWANSVNKRLDNIAKRRTHQPDNEKLISWLATCWNRVLHRLGCLLRNTATAEGTQAQLLAQLKIIATCPDEADDSFTTFNPATDSVIKKPAKRGAGSNPASKAKKSKTGKPTSSTDDEPIPCFRHVCSEAKVPGRAPCPQDATSCFYSHGPFSSYSGSDTMKAFEEKLFIDQFPNASTRSRAISLVKKWITGKGGFAK